MEIRTIHCPVDFTPISERNLRMGVEMCKRIGSKLVLHHNLDSRPPGFLSVSWMWSGDHEREAEEKKAEVPSQLADLISRIPDGIDYEARVTRGPVEETVLFVARGLPADLIIMGTHGKTDAEHDSLTERIVLQAPCPVMTIGESYDPSAVFDARKGPGAETMRFLVPVDLTARSWNVFQHALDLARDMPHRITVLHVVKPGQDTAQTEREIAAARKRLEKLVPENLEDRVEVIVKQGDAVAQIVETARDMRALGIIMGAHGKGMLRRFLFGTTTLGVLHEADSPVWFVPDQS